MSNKTYQNHIKSIKKYLTSNKFIEGFGIDSFTNTIINEIRNDLLSTKR